VLALPGSRPSAEPGFVVPPATPADARRAPPEPQSAPAAAEVTPPGFNAAYLRNPPPRYPLVARRAGEQGTVMLKVLVTRDGLPARVDIEKTSGSVHLDNAALEAVRAWRFLPARQGADPIEAWVLVPIAFRLEGSS
jgi:protein TonB